MKVVFLDIDGVLNTYSTKKTVAGYTFVEDELVKMLKQLVARTGAKLVLSSTWREGWAMIEHPEEFPKVSQADIRLYETLREKLQEYGMTLLDYTPIFGPRGKEIDYWLQHGAPEPVESFVILDDMSDRELWPHSWCLVQTNMCEGLAQRHVEAAVAILDGKPSTMKYRWIREDIELDFELPESLMPLIEALKRLDKAEDYAYFNYAEALDDAAKELTRKGELNQRQWDMLVERYGG